MNHPLRSRAFFLNLTVYIFAIIAAILSFLITSPALAATFNITARASGTTANLYSVDFSDANIGVAVGDSGTLLRTTNGGTTWTAVNSGTTQQLRHIRFAKGSPMAYAVGSFGTVVTTSDGGATWNTVNTGTGETLEAVSLRDGQNIVIGGANGTLLVSTNWGNTWSAKNLGTQRRVTALSAIPNSAQIWAMLENNIFAKSNDDGATWTFLTMPGFGDLQEIYLTSIAGTVPVAYASGVNGKIVKSTNGGASWSVLTVPAEVGTESLNGITGADGNNITVVGTFGTIIMSTDGGTTWTKQANTNATHLHSVVAPSNSYTKLFAVGNGGTIFQIEKVASTAPSAPENLKATGADANTNNSVNTATPIITWTAATKGSNEITGYQVKIDNGTYSGVGLVTQYTLPSQTNGLHTIRVRAADQEGLTSAEAVVSFTVDTLAPSVSVPATSATVTIGSSPTFTITAGDSHSLVNYCRLYVNGAEQGSMSLVSAVASTYSRAYTFATAGTFVLTARCWDNAGNSAISNNSSITLTASGETSQPTITNTSPSTATSMVSSNTSIAGADGVSYATLTITVKNAQGQLLANKLVAVNTTRPTSDAVMAVSATTNAAGVASFQVKSAVVGLSSFTGYADGIPLGSVSVSFVTPGSPGTGQMPSAPAQSSGSSPIMSGQPSVGTLIKLACPAGSDISHPCRAVYFVGPTGKRHAFSNAKVYFSWYSDFSNINIVSAEAMASLMLGKNIVYRPGYKLVKFQTNNTVYAVSKGGILRPVNSEQIAKALYGTTWNKQVDDISDAFINDYWFGVEVQSNSDFQPSLELSNVNSLILNF